jgi:predicted transcriptional regulator
MESMTLVRMTSDIVSAHASFNELSTSDLLGEIEKVFRKLAELGGGADVPSEGTELAEQAPETSPEAEIKPAVPREAAFGSDKVFCMVCGKGMKTLKRHISAAHGMKPGQYRKQFDLPAGIPLVAKNYSEARKAMAKDLNLADRLVKARAARGKKTKRARG